MTEETTWGPEIEVNGKRPNWLVGRVLCDLKTSVGWTASRQIEPHTAPAEKWSWKHSDGRPCILSIRLPAHHAHYKTLRTSDEALQRMEVLVRKMAARYNSGSGDYADMGRDALPWMREAEELVRLLPEPVDPDEAETDQLMRLDLSTRLIVLAAIKRGRELQREGK